MDFVELLKLTTDGGVIALLAVVIVIGAVIILPAFLKTLKEQRQELVDAINSQRKEFTHALQDQGQKCEAMVARAEEEHRKTSTALDNLSRNISQLTLIVQMGLRNPGARTRDGEQDHDR